MGNINRRSRLVSGATPIRTTQNLRGSHERSVNGRRAGCLLFVRGRLLFVRRRLRKTPRRRAAAVELNGAEYNVIRIPRHADGRGKTRSRVVLFYARGVQKCKSSTSHSLPSVASLSRNPEIQFVRPERQTGRLVVKVTDVPLFSPIHTHSF